MVNSSRLLVSFAGPLPGLSSDTCGSLVQPALAFTSTPNPILTRKGRLQWPGYHESQSQGSLPASPYFCWPVTLTEWQL